MNGKNAEKQQMLSLTDKFKFECRKDFACFNRCCKDVNIFLTPYDVLRMKNNTGLSSSEFLKKFTITLLGEEGLPLVVLKMCEDEEKNCPFISRKGCLIYHDRPWSCRMYPVFPVFSNNEEGYLIKEKSSCLGFQGEKQWTIEEWKKDQGIYIYDKMNVSYREITLHEYFKKGNKLDQGKAKMLYRACYDIDEFRKFLFKTRFFEIYDVQEDLIDNIHEDDEELLKFAYTWVKFILFSEGVLKAKDKALDKLLQARRKEESDLWS